MINKKVAVIGAGPAGIACAIQLRRQGINPLVFEKHKIGGLLRNANSVENYPGFPKGINGIKLCMLFGEHLRNLEIEVIFEEILKIEFESEVFKLYSKNDTYKTEILVIASGTKPVQPMDIDISADALTRVFYETESLTGLKKSTVVVVGAGDAAFDYSINLSDKNDIILLNRSDKTKCLELLYNRALSKSNIKYLTNISISGINFKSGKLSIELNNNDSIIADYLIFAIGREPNIDFLDNSFLEKSDYLNSERRLYTIGDVKNNKFRQSSISIGEGVRAAMEIVSFIERKSV